MLRFFVTIIAVLALTHAPAQEKPAPTLTGAWQFEVHHTAGVSTPTVTIAQKDDRLTGKYVGIRRVRS